MEEMMEALGAFLGVETVAQNRREAPPNYPYLACHLRGAAAPPKGSVCRLSGKTYWQSVQNWSFTAVAGQAEQARKLAERALGWFCENGAIFFSDRGDAVRRVSGLQNRDILLSVEYERREGFDVELAVMYEVEEEVGKDVIEQAEITITEEIGRVSDVQ